MNIEHRPFRRDDFEDFRSWFADDRIQNSLGPLDQEWLDCVLAEQPPAQFSFFVNNELVAVAGIVRPNHEHPYFVITDLAVHPTKQRTGIGASVVQILQNHFQISDGLNSWKAFVALDNLGAQEFFSNLSWNRCANKDDEMVCYCFDA